MNQRANKKVKFHTVMNARKVINGGAMGGNGEEGGYFKWDR